MKAIFATILRRPFKLITIVTTNINITSLVQHGIQQYQAKGYHCTLHATVPAAKLSLVLCATRCSVWQCVVACQGPRVDTVAIDKFRSRFLSRKSELSASA